ncbi:MAG: fibrillarin-like rRNA/tRNA 2'-O-methyltransferase [Candidatus Micrarchaeota archaeon]|nr:fibrillarin-like rRNA/tRNA 2'-O-methyltransferase [Candidatus Micrarchaeota archaeon]
MRFEKVFEGVYRIDGKLATENLVPGTRVYGEELIEHNGSEYRLWNPYRSKMAAAILNGLKTFKIAKGSSVLYLGAATGTTASHISDIVGKEGRLYCVELSERNMRELLGVCDRRRNMLPILADANDTDKYAGIVDECDAIYQDVSAKNQAEIMAINSRFLKKGGYSYFIIKSQSVDVSKKPSEVFESELKQLKGKFDIVEKIDIEPYDKLHMFSVLQKQ